MNILINPKSYLRNWFIRLFLFFIDTQEIQDSLSSLYLDKLNNKWSDLFQKESIFNFNKLDELFSETKDEEQKFLEIIYIDEEIQENENEEIQIPEDESNNIKLVIIY